MQEIIIKLLVKGDILLLVGSVKQIHVNKQGQLRLARATGEKSNFSKTFNTVSRQKFSLGK